jgi:hypothetical protein
MGDEVFTPGSPEAEIDQRKKVLVMPQDERGKIGYVVLTNDRILFSQQKWDAGVGGGALTTLVAQGLNKRADKKSGGPQEIIPLADVRSIKVIRRRMRGDVYEFTMADGSTCAVDKSAMKHWDDTVRRLLTERHGRSVSADGEDSWQVQ